MRKKKGKKIFHSVQEYWQSYSDMMAALLLMFILIMATTLYQSLSTFEQKNAELEELLKEYCAASPASGETAALLRFLFTAPDAHREPKSLYWMLIAVQGLGMQAAQFLNQADAAALAEEYAERYPRRERLPVQKQMLKTLERLAR